MARSQRSRRDSKTHKHNGEISPNLSEISVISLRWRISRRDLAEIKNVTNIMARSLQSRRDHGNLGEKEDISPRSHRDLESNKHHGEISARSLQSRRDLINLGKISPISARSRQSWRDLGENFAREGSPGLAEEGTVKFPCHCKTKLSKKVSDWQ